MKKNIVVFCFLSCLGIVGFSQTVQIDPRLDAVYSEDYLDFLAENNSQKLDYMNWCLDNSYKIVEMSPDKYIHLPYLKYYDPINKLVGDEVVDIYESDQFNIHMFSFVRDKNIHVMYRIGDTGKVIIFESKTKLLKYFKKYQNENI